ncbi:MAG: hypothetical protein IKL52_03715, partial [Candidatus Gastranaerophilales bacterium]|nr:hypothetical protein [Candidatus Gastranaerophilales bacterium]
MSRLKIDNINFEESDFLVEISKEEKKVEILQEDVDVQKEIEKNTQEATLILNRAKEQAQILLEEAQNQVKKILEQKEEIEQEAQQRKQEIIDEAIKRADEIVESARTTSKEEHE